MTFPASSDSLEQPVINGRPRYSGNNFFSFIRTPRAPTKKATSDANGSVISVSRSDPSHRLSFHDANIDLRWVIFRPSRLHRPGEAVVCDRARSPGLTLKMFAPSCRSAVFSDLHRAEECRPSPIQFVDLVIWILEEKASWQRFPAHLRNQLRTMLQAEPLSTSRPSRYESRFWVAHAGTHFYIEQVLLPTLTHIGQPPIARSGSSLAKTHRSPSVLARACPPLAWRSRESAMIRAQRSA